MNIMGASESTTVIKSLSETINNIAASTVQSCEVQSDQSQTLTVSNSGFKLWGNYAVDQQTDIKIDCFSDISKQTSLQNSIINTISQANTASNIAILGAFGNSAAEARANLTNLVKNNITMSNIQRSYNLIKQNQKASFSNSGIVVIENIQLTQGAKIFAAATLKEIDNIGVFNTISNYIDQKSKAETKNPLDFIASIFTSMGNTFMILVFLIIIVVAAMAYGAYKIFDIQLFD